MFDEYGNKQVYLVQPTWIDYAVPNHGQIDKIWLEEVFRTYYTCNTKGCNGGLRIQLNREQAECFANNNQLTLITDYEQDELLK